MHGTHWGAILQGSSSSSSRNFCACLDAPPPHVKDQFGWLDEDLNSCNTPVCSPWAKRSCGVSQVRGSIPNASLATSPNPASPQPYTSLPLPRTPEYAKLPEPLHEKTPESFNLQNPMPQNLTSQSLKSPSPEPLTDPRSPGTHIVGSWVIDRISFLRDPRTGTQYTGNWASRVIWVWGSGLRGGFQTG